MSVKTSLLFLLLLLSHSLWAGISNYMVWHKVELKVCFAGKGTQLRVKDAAGVLANWTSDQKKFIQDTLKKEFTPSRTGYYFTGFKNCLKGQDADVVIVKKPFYTAINFEARGFATVGYGLLNVADDIPKARGLVLLTSRGVDNYATVVHEFSHVLGLKHEHDHPEAKQLAEKWCDDYANAHTTFYHYNLYTPFDEVSVMNYCHIRKNKKAGLSSGDREHIRLLFERAGL